MIVKNAVLLAVGIVLLATGGWTVKNKVPDSIKSMPGRELFFLLAITLMTSGVFILAMTLFSILKPPAP